MGWAVSERVTQEDCATWRNIFSKKGTSSFGPVYGRIAKASFAGWLLFTFVHQNSQRVAADGVDSWWWVEQTCSKVDVGYGIYEACGHSSH